MDMMDKIPVTAVSYLNTKPFLYGLFKMGLDSAIDLQLDIPARCAEKLGRGEAWMGLVPVAAIPGIPGARIISDYCIGADGEVGTVCLFGQTPIEEWDTLYLDYHSRTSVELTRLLLREYWQLSPQLLPAEPGFEEKIGGRTGALVIGDRAFGLASRYPWVYDLGTAWKEHTGLPFVFAAWVATRTLDPGFLNRFNEGLRAGLDAIPQLVYLLPSPVPGIDLKHYFTHHISYELDAGKKSALRRFLQAIQPGYEPHFLIQTEDKSYHETI